MTVEEKEKREEEEDSNNIPATECILSYRVLNPCTINSTTTTTTTTTTPTTLYSTQGPSIDSHPFVIDLPEGHGRFIFTQLLAP